MNKKEIEQFKEFKKQLKEISNKLNSLNGNVKKYKNESNRNTKLAIGVAFLGIAVSYFVTGASILGGSTAVGIVSFIAGFAFLILAGYTFYLVKFKGENNGNL